MRKLRVGLALAIAICSSPRPAAAAVSMFHFGGSNQAVQGQTYSPVSGSTRYNVTVYGAKVGSQPSLTSGGQAYLVPEGLGVLDPSAASGDVNSLVNRVQVNGTLGGEYIRLQFNESVQISQLKFAFAGLGEKFDIAVDGKNLDVAALLGTDEIYQLAPAGQFRGTVNLPSSVMPFGKTWDIIAPSVTDSWNLENCEVVPEPATLAIWSVLSLGAMAYRPLRRRVGK
jgi:hypothetical protein